MLPPEEVRLVLVVLAMAYLLTPPGELRRRLVDPVLRWLHRRDRPDT